MVLDGILCVIMLVSAICYAKRGFAKSVLSTLSWIASLALGLFFCSDVKKFLAGTGVVKSFEERVEESIADSLGSSPLISGVPKNFSPAAEQATDVIAKEMTKTISGLVLTVLSFLLLILAVKLVLSILMHLFSKDHHDGVIATVDTAGGLALGVVMGVLFVFLFLAFLVLVIELSGEDTSQKIQFQLETSFFAGFLYDNNPLMMLF